MAFNPVLHPAPVAPEIVISAPAVVEILEFSAGSTSALEAVQTAGAAFLHVDIAMVWLTYDPFFRTPITLLAKAPPNVCAAENLAGASVCSSPCVPTSTYPPPPNVTPSQ